MIYSAGHIIGLGEAELAYRPLSYFQYISGLGRILAAFSRNQVNPYSFDEWKYGSYIL